MGRKRNANLEIEYELERQIKDLKQENAKLKKLLREKEKADKLEKVEKEPKKAEVKKVDKPCPDCGAALKISELPHGTLSLCSKACGYRQMQVKK